MKASKIEAGEVLQPVVVVVQHVSANSMQPALHLKGQFIHITSRHYAAPATIHPQTNKQRSANLG
jgi:hypothetical protein